MTFNNLNIAYTTYNTITDIQNVFQTSLSIQDLDIKKFLILYFPLRNFLDYVGPVNFVAYFSVAILCKRAAVSTSRFFQTTLA